MKGGILFRLLGATGGAAAGTQPLATCIAVFGIQCLVTTIIVIGAIHVARKLGHVIPRKINYDKLFIQ